MEYTIRNDYFNKIKQDMPKKILIWPILSIITSIGILICDICKFDDLLMIILFFFDIIIFFLYMFFLKRYENKMDLKMFLSVHKNDNIDIADPNTFDTSISSIIYKSKIHNLVEILHQVGIYSIKQIDSLIYKYKKRIKYVTKDTDFYIFRVLIPVASFSGINSIGLIISLFKNEKYIVGWRDVFVILFVMLLVSGFILLVMKQHNVYEVSGLRRMISDLEDIKIFYHDDFVD